MSTVARVDFDEKTLKLYADNNYYIVCTRARRVLLYYVMGKHAPKSTRLARGYYFERAKSSVLAIVVLHTAVTPSRLLFNYLIMFYERNRFVDIIISCTHLTIAPTYYISTYTDFTTSVFKHRRQN